MKNQSVSRYLVPAVQSSIIDLLWHQFATCLSFFERDIAQARSRLYKKNDQATVESMNSHVVRKHAFYWRYDTSAELALLRELWPLVSMRLNFFTPTKNPSGYATAVVRSQ